MMQRVEQIDSLRVKIGAESRDQNTGFEEIDVAKMIKHENYKPDPEFKDDIGLLKLERPYVNKGLYYNSLYLTYNVHIFNTNSLEQVKTFDFQEKLSRQTPFVFLLTKSPRRRTLMLM